ncbi:MAG: cysteine desulfurase-like protein [bacterium]|nr:cysteine desulfurase-like protein [bacterium]
MTTTKLDIDALRAQFPSLSQQVSDRTPIYFDNPAGTQVPQRVIDAVTGYFTHMNANQGGAFHTSRATDALVSAVREKVARFLNAPHPDEIVFGPNMTTLNFALSRALAHTLQPGDEIVLTRMDHDANVSPWLRIAADRGLTVRWVDIITPECTLDLNTLEAALTDRTRIVATVHASNAVGTINPVAQIAQMAHAAGALIVVDAVQSAPHLPIDVQAIGCDFLLCSSYKFFGPHAGILWGRYDLLASLPAYKVRPSKDVPPYRWETGTPAFELIAGVGAAVDYLMEIGIDRLLAYERDLAAHLIDVLRRIPGVQIAGITDPARYHERVPTVAFSLDGYTPTEIASHLAAHAIYVWDGNYYAVEIMRRLNRPDGMVRVGLAHYNTHAEIDQFEGALKLLR